MINFVNIIAILSLIIIWSIILLNIVLIVAGYLYGIDVEKQELNLLSDANLPFVSILIPAHNEEKVIKNTLLSMLKLDYPHNKFEIIVINDNSSDNSKDILEQIKKDNPKFNINLIHTTAENGGKGKSNALNIGFKESKGRVLAIYDADNTPKTDALRILVSKLLENDEFGAVIGKFKTRNRNVNLLTRFINIETLSFQWMAQAGRFKLFKLCTIPGTNFVIKRDIIENIGGWDEKAIAEDTEISFRIYKMGKIIGFAPQAVTYEQEPQTLKVWFKQRTRWAKGNIYVLLKNLPLLFTNAPLSLKFDLLYFLSTYILLLSSLILSDILFIFNLFDLLPQNIESFSTILWLLAFIMFVLGIYVTLLYEKGELVFSNICIVIIMYFSYTKMWIVVSFYAFYLFIKDTILKSEVKWYKTERF